MRHYLCSSSDFLHSRSNCSHFLWDRLRAYLKWYLLRLANALTYRRMSIYSEHKHILSRSDFIVVTAMLNAIGKWLSFTIKFTTRNQQKKFDSLPLEGLWSFKFYHITGIFLLHPPGSLQIVFWFPSAVQLRWFKCPYSHFSAPTLAEICWLSKGTRGTGVAILE